MFIHADDIDLDFDWYSDLDLESIVRETSANMDDPSNFLYSLLSTCELIEKEYQLRLIRWFQFFNKHYYKCPTIICNTYSALLEYSEKNELFRTQTQFEFELSLEFYIKLFNSKAILITDDEIYSKKLLSISLIYSKYPGQQSHPFKDAFSKLSLNPSNEDFINLFTNLMVKYQSPRSIITHIEKLDLKEVDMLMYYLRGNNIKNYPGLEYKISNRDMEVMLFDIPADVIIKDNVMKKYAAMAKVINESSEYTYIVDFFNYSKIFRYRIDDFMDEIGFWIRAYNLIANSMIPYYYSISDYLDFVEHKKRVHGKAYTLKGVNPISFREAIMEWHEQVYKKKDDDLIRKKWQGTLKENYELMHDTELYQFSEIRDGLTLFKESNMMKHCVFSYVQNCLDGICSIWSLKKKTNTVYKNLLTIEIQNNAIVQVRGLQNRLPDQNELKVIEEWAKEYGFEINKK